MERIRVFLADDHELVRYALRSLLEVEPDIEVVGEAADSETAVRGCVEAVPDVLLLDLHMPGEGGVEVCREVTHACPSVSVVVLTSFDGDEEVFGAVGAGACGFLLKDTPPERMVQSIRAVASGQSVFDTGVATRIIHGCATGYDDADALSDREMEVLQLMAKGMSNKEIGRALWIGETTVKTHVSHILRKLKQSDRTSAVLCAVKAGLVRIGS
jgi:DNA-binding NarL/FixJ family response regulator